MKLEFKKPENKESWIALGINLLLIVIVVGGALANIFSPLLGNNYLSQALIGLALGIGIVNQIFVTFAKDYWTGKKEGLLEGLEMHEKSDEEVIQDIVRRITEDLRNKGIDVTVIAERMHES